MCTDWNYINVRDFTYLNDMWSSISKLTDDKIAVKIHELGEQLKKELELPIASFPLSADQSKFFKTVYHNPVRISKEVIDPE